ncbi:hypothetical protein HHI36_014808 [Cryptolaemus montrouzieri]|uniref:Uncharacterized protein n=1 Tax=Cryptolaemus montrouzieri TaxID=559131 RepID=A0ABD2N3Q5_9CUCU
MQILMSRVSADGTNIYKTKIGNNNKTIRKGRPCSNQELRDLDGLPGSSRNHEELGNLNLEELLILKVQQRPALYNFRLPLKERMRNITKQMWIDIWRSLNGLYQI